MTDYEIFEMVIEKALKNGWKWDQSKNSLSYAITVPKIYRQISPYQEPTSNDIIFSHDFAKAFWKDSKSPFTYHLQSMVVEENPFNYLSLFVKGGE